MNFTRLLFIGFLLMLTPEDEQRVIYESLKARFNESFPELETIIATIKEQRYKDGYRCPYCSSKSVIMHGKSARGKQRYYCKDCKKTFMDLSNTPLAGLRKIEEFAKFLQYFLRGYSLRDCAKELGLSHVTCFFWRHKLSHMLKQYDVDKFDGIVEVDETYFLYSRKGHNKVNWAPRKRGGCASQRGISQQQVCVLVAIDRNNNIYSKVACRGRISLDKLEKMIGDKLSEENTLCSDAWKSYKILAHKKKMPHYELDSSKKIRSIKGIYHIQHVNSYHSRLKAWLFKFNGVSTKYLDNYLAWFKYLDYIRNEETIKTLNDLLILCCCPSRHIINRNINKFSVAV